jgi:hypothetical protein
MRNLLFISLLLTLSFQTSAQGDVTDEFEITEPTAEINAPKDIVNPDQNMLDEPGRATPELNEASTPNEVPLELSTQKSEPTPVDDGTVLVQERNEEQVQRVDNPNELVELRSPQDVFLPYKQRQNSWGFLFSIGAEQTKFPRYITQIGDPATDFFNFSDLMGPSGVTQLSIELGPKYNTKMGSFALLGGYGSIDARSDHVGSTTNFSMQRYSATVIYYLDTLFAEAYAIPYFGAGIWQADMEESSAALPDEVGKFSSEPGSQYRFGALFGLDWIEGDAARVSRRKNGTQGTFLNVYAITTSMSESNPQADISSDMDLGASLVIEF